MALKPYILVMKDNSRKTHASSFQAHARASCTITFLASRMANKKKAIHVRLEAEIKKQVEEVAKLFCENRLF
jgi:hypothetical protein